MNGLTLKSVLIIAAFLPSLTFATTQDKMFSSPLGCMACHQQNESIPQHQTSKKKSKQTHSTSQNHQQHQ